MNLLAVIFIVLALVGLLWLGRTYGSPLTKKVTSVALGIAILLAVCAILIWLLNYFGVLSTLSSVHLGRHR